VIADIQESRVEPGQNRLARTSGIRPEADISLECLKMSANDPKRTKGTDDLADFAGICQSQYLMMITGFDLRKSQSRSAYNSTIAPVNCPRKKCDTRECAKILILLAYLPYPLGIQCDLRSISSLFVVSSSIVREAKVYYRFLGQRISYVFGRHRGGHYCYRFFLVLADGCYEY